MGKNGASIYYSWIGNTKVVAEEIQRLIGSDILRIEEKKERKLVNIMGAAISAFFGFQAVKDVIQNVDGCHLRNISGYSIKLQPNILIIAF